LLLCDIAAMAITSASTQADIVGQYLDNLDYDHSSSVSACKLFIAACRALLVMHPNDWQQNNSRVTFSPQLWRQEQQSAQTWLNANSTAVGTGSVKHLSFGCDFR